VKKDDLIRVRCSTAQKERLKAVAGEGKLSEFMLEAALLAAAQHEHGSATRTSSRPKLSTNDVQIPEPVKLSDGTRLGGKKTYDADPK